MVDRPQLINQFTYSRSGRNGGEGTDTLQELGERRFRNGDLCHLKYCPSRMADYCRPDLYEL
jgi:hypothetical protein